MYKRQVSVARYLYPEAHIEKCDIRQYYPEQRFDVIIGNPPFNLKFDYKLSQEYYMDKAYDVPLKLQRCWEFDILFFRAVWPG